MDRYTTKMKLSYFDYLRAAGKDCIDNDDINKWIDQTTDIYNTTQNDGVVAHTFSVPDKYSTLIRKKKYNVVCNGYEVDSEHQRILMDLELVLDK